MNAVNSVVGPLAADVVTQAPLRALAAVGALAAFGVFLIFGHAPGLGAAVFVGAVEAAAVLAAAAPRQASLACAAVGAATLAPLVEYASLLSLAISAFGAGAVALIANGEARGDFARTGLRVSRFLAIGPFNVLFDLPNVAVRASHGGIGARALIAWMLPLGMGAVFLALFAAANPVIDSWLSALDIATLLAALDVRRIALWIVLFAVVWPFVLFRAPARKSPVASAPAEAGPVLGAGGRILSSVFTDAATLRSLVLFNAMFAVQTVLDASILWAGHGLPSGMSFASYAHRGAYPLVVTALLAGGFVALAMRPRAGAARSATIRALVYLWVAQNVALVLSSLYRLDLYVRVYSLTYWRVAAFVWMALVAVGLLLIVFQIFTRRSGRWLLSANLIVGAGALYAVAMIDLDYVIADFNLRHCGEVSREGTDLDIGYLGSLGPDAIPALNEALATPGPLSSNSRLAAVLADLDHGRREAEFDWRSWTFRGWRLSRRLDVGSLS